MDDIRNRMLDGYQREMAKLDIELDANIVKRADPVRLIEIFRQLRVYKRLIQALDDIPPSGHPR